MAPVRVGGTARFPIFADEETGVAKQWNGTSWVEVGRVDPLASVTERGERAAEEISVGSIASVAMQGVRDTIGRLGVAGLATGAPGITDEMVAADIARRQESRPQQPGAVADLIGGLAPEFADVTDAYERGAWGEMALESADALGQTVWDAARNPGAAAYLTAESLANMVPSVVLGYLGGQGGAGVGALTGAALGAPAAGAGAAPGAVAGGIIGGTVGAAGGMMAGQVPVEMGAEIEQALFERMEADGADPRDRDTVLQYLRSPGLLEEARAIGVRKGIGTGGSDAIMNAAIGLLSRGIVNNVSRAVVGGTAQLASEPTSEAVGQLYAHGEMDPEELAAEALGGFGPAAAETALTSFGYANPAAPRQQPPPPAQDQPANENPSPPTYEPAGPGLPAPEGQLALPSPEMVANQPPPDLGRGAVYPIGGGRFVGTNAAGQQQAFASEAEASQFANTDTRPPPGDTMDRLAAAQAARRASEGRPTGPFAPASAVPTPGASPDIAGFLPPPEAYQPTPPVSTDPYSPIAQPSGPAIARPGDLYPDVSEDMARMGLTGDRFPLGERTVETPPVYDPGADMARFGIAPQTMQPPGPATIEVAAPQQPQGVEPPSYDPPAVEDTGPAAPSAEQIRGLFPRGYTAEARGDQIVVADEQGRPVRSGAPGRLEAWQRKAERHVQDRIEAGDPPAVNDGPSVAETDGDAAAAGAVADAQTMEETGAPPVVDARDRQRQENIARVQEALPGYPVGQDVNEFGGVTDEAAAWLYNATDEQLDAAERLTPIAPFVQFVKEGRAGQAAASNPAAPQNPPPSGRPAIVYTVPDALTRLNARLPEGFTAERSTEDNAEVLVSDAAGNVVARDRVPTGTVTLDQIVEDIGRRPAPTPTDTASLESMFTDLVAEEFGDTTPAARPAPESRPAPAAPPASSPAPAASEPAPSPAPRGPTVDFVSVGPDGQSSTFTPNDPTLAAAGQSTASGRPARPRTAGEAAGSAARNLGGAASDGLRGLMQLFGNADPNRLGSGPTFDEETYRQAVPYFKSAAQQVGAAAQDVADIMRAIIRALRDMGMDRAGVDRMAPYAARFVQDVQAGRETLEADAPPARTNTDTVRERLTQRFADSLSEGTEYKSITDARKEASKLLGEKVEAGTPLAKTVDEAMEAAGVLAATEIVNLGGSPAATYTELRSLQQRLPKLGVRTSTSRTQQAYSTPLPIAYLASRLAGITDGTTVYEPSAGNGALLIEAAPENVTANELNPDRAATLRTMLPDARILEQDATSVGAVGPVDVVIANPPFGTVKGDDGENLTWDIDEEYTTREIDHAIAMRALDNLKDNGRAVLLVGGVNKRLTDFESVSDAYNSKSKREFYKKLYDGYNVTDHFTVDGDLYAQQGAGWPIDVIVIKGRGKSQRRYPTAEPPRIYRSYDALLEVLDGPANSTRADRLTPAQPDGVGGADGTAGNAGSDAGNTLPPRSAGIRGSGPVPGGVDQRPTDGGSVGQQPADAGGERDGQSGSQDRNDGVREPARPAVSGATETEGQVSYAVASSGYSLDTLVPRNMKDSIADSLGRLTARVGDIDAFVADRLGVPRGNLFDFLAGEQVDALALAIDNMEKGSAFILGDQTGIGKGRVVAAVLRYAIRQGRTPIFVTEKPNLYGDMYRDLQAVGVPEMLGRTPKILMTNADESIALTDDGSVTLKSAGSKAHNNELLRAAQNGASEYDLVFTTYSQMSPQAGALDKPRHQLLRQLASDNFIAFDESHNAGGQGVQSGEQQDVSRAQFAREIARSARGVTFSSATYAKRPGVMDLYGNTDMRFAVASLDKLPEAISAGGVPMQQVVAAMLARAGQYIRRERSFAGVEYNTPAVPVDQKAYDRYSEALYRINDFGTRVVGPVITGLRKSAKDSGGGGAQGSNATKIETTAFSSVLHNLINQMLLAIKSDQAANLAIEAIKRGEKPVITVANTLESAISDYAESVGLAPGDAIGFTFNQMLENYLVKTRYYTERKPFSKGPFPKKYITDEMLGPSGVQAFDAVKKMIRDMDLQNLPPSPIDHIRQKIEAAGYKVGEITGRTDRIENRGGTMTYARRPSSEKSITGRQKQIRGFNDGSIDAMILNQSGSTGLSLHASKDFKDQRPRRMIIAQAEANIDTHMQMLGRIHRTGQVALPIFDQLVADIPAEKRPAAVLARKMASLNANTTASRKTALTAKDTPDFMNDIGDEVAQRVLRDMPEAAVRMDLGDLLSEKPVENAMVRLTGRIPLLPLDEQVALYDVLEQEYRDTLAQLEAAGESPLEAKTLDLQARTVDRRQVVAPSIVGSPFGEAVFLERMSVKRTSKPFTSDQVMDKLRETTQAEPGMDLNGLRRAGQRWTGWIAQDAMQAFREYSREILDGIEDSKRLTGQRKKLDGNETRFKDMAGALTIGRTVKVMTDAGNMFGVVVDMKKSGAAKNPLALGSWKATIYLADANRQITIPFSQAFTQGNKPEGETRAYIIEGAGDIYGRPNLQAFDEMQADVREEADFITGNLLAGFAHVNQKGTIINFTDENGEIRQAIRLPKTYDYDKETNQKAVLFRSPDQVMAFLEGGSNRSVDVNDGDLIVSRRGDGYELSAAANKSKGERFWGNRGLLALTGDFVSRSGRMVARVGSDAIPSVFDQLKMMGVQFAAGNDLDAARKIVADVAGLSSDPATIADGRTNFSLAPLGRQSKGRASAAAEVIGLVSQMTGGQAEVTTAEVIYGAGQGLQRSGALTGERQRVAGFYDPTRALVGVALDGYEADVTAVHEAVHFLQDKGLIPEADRKLLRADRARLERAAIGEGFEPEAAKRMTQTELEAVAAQGYYRRRKVGEDIGGYSVPMRRVFNRLMQFFERLGNALRGRGYRSLDDVFGDMIEGRMANPPKLTGREFGTAFSQIRKRAEEHLLSLRGQTVVNRATGMQIEFDKTGMKRAQRAGADLLRTLPAIKEMLERGVPLPGETVDARKVERGVKAVYKFRAEAIVGGDRKRVILTVREMGNGRFFYAINDDMGESSRRREALTGASAAEPSTHWKDSPAGESDIAAEIDVSNPEVQYRIFQRAAAPAYAKGRVRQDQTPDAIKDVMGRVMAQPDNRSIRERARDAKAAYSGKLKSKLRTGLVDDFDPLREPYPRAWRRYKQTRNLSSVINHVIEFGHMRWDPESGWFASGAATNDGKPAEGVKGFRQVLQPAIDSGLLDTWKAQRIAKRAKRLAAEGLERLVSQEDIAKVEAAVAGLTDQQREILAQTDRDFNRLNRGMIKAAVDSGLIDGDIAEQLLQHGDWIPFYRVLDGDATAGGLLADRKNPQANLKRLKGSTREMLDPLEGITRNYIRLTDAMFKNAAKRQAHKMMIQMGDAEFMSPGRVPVDKAMVDGRLAQLAAEYGFKPDNLPPATVSAWQKMIRDQIIEETMTRDGDVSVHYERGAKRFVRVHDPEMLATIEAVGPRETDRLLRLMGIPKRILTKAVTATPVFMATNAVRDTLGAWVTGETKGFRPFAGAMVGAVKAMRSDPDLLQMMATGSGSGGYFNTTSQHIEDRMKRMDPAKRSAFQKTVVDTPAKMWDAWERIGQASEAANRLEIYQKQRQAGVGVADAAFMGMDLIDFASTGKWWVARALIEVIPFLNPRIQGLDKLARTMTGRRMWINGSIIAAASMALAAANGDDERYERLENWEKNLYWHIWLDDDPDSSPIRIPKPFEVGILFGSAWERAVDQATGRDRPADFRTFIQDSLTDTLAFNLWPQAILPYVEMTQNRSHFYDRPIETFGMSFRDPETRYNERTSETMRVISAALAESPAKGAELSPVQLEHLWNGYFGTLGTYVLGAADQVTRFAGDFPDRPSDGMRGIPVLGPVIRRFSPEGVSRNSRYLTQFYDFASEIDQLKSTLNWAQNNNDERLIAEIMGDERDRTLLRARSTFRDLRSRFSDANERIRQIRNSDMSRDEKRRRIDAIALNMHQQAQSLVGRLNEQL